MIDLFKMFVKAFFLSLIVSSYSLIIYAAQTNSSQDNQYLTAQERAWIKEHPLIKVHNESNWAPFNFTTNGKADGFSIEYMNLLANKAGFKIQYVNGPTWNEFLGMMRSGELDVMLNIVQTTERSEYLEFTSPYSIVSPVLAIRNEDKDIFSLDNLGEKTVCLPKGSSTHDYLALNHPQMKLRPLEDALACLRAVQEHRVDFALDGDAILNSIFSRNNIKGLRISKVAVDPAMASVLRIATRQDSSILRDILEKTIQQLDDKKVSQLHLKWLDSKLSEEELSRLANKQKSSTKKEDISAITAIANEYLTSLAVTAVIIVVLLLLMVYLSKKMAGSNKVAIQTGTRQFRILLLLSLSIFLGSIAILGWLEMGKIKTKILKNLESNLNTILTTTDERLNNWVAQEQFSLEQIANNSALLIETEKLLEVDNENAVLVGSQELKDVREILKQSSKLLGLGYFIINKAGTTIASSRDDNIGSTNLIAIQRTGLLEEVFKGKSIFIPSVNSDITDVSHNSSLFFAVPIKNKANDVVAVLTKRLDPANKFSQVLHYSRVGESGETYAFDKNGTLLSESRFEDDLRNIGLINNEQSSLLNIEIRDPGINLLQTKQIIQSEKLPLTLMAESAIKMSDLTASRVANTERIVESNLQGYRDYRGVPVVGAWLWSTQLDMGITSEMDLEEALSIYNTMKFAAISVFSITLLFIIGGTFFILIMGEKTNRIASRAKKELEDQVEERTKNLKVSEEKSRAIVDNSQDAIIVINEESIIMSWNKAAESIFGYLSADIMGQSVTTIIPPSHHADHSQGIARYIKTKKKTLINKGTVELSAINSKGETLPIEMALSTYEIDGANFFSANIRDITDRIEAERVIVFAREQAESATAAKSDFLANMSHEIRTPMNAIIGLSDLALRTDLNRKQQDYLTKVHSSANALLGIINDILDFSKIEAGKLKMEVIEFSIDEVLENLATVASVKTQEKGLELLFSRDPDVPVNLLGDPLRIGQILINLSNNATKFTDEGEIILTIKLVEKVADKVTIRFCIEDTGIGMTEQQMGKLFKSFSQADTSTSRKYGGTGLGLTISKQLVEMMDGKIWLESEPDIGSKFYFDIKLNINLNPKTKIKTLSSDLEGLKVLTVDDNPHAREILEKYLKDFGLQVVSVSSAEDAFEALTTEEQPFDLVFMDFVMPNGMDGVTATKHIKQNMALAVIPKVILVTAYGYDEYADMDGVSLLDNELHKPVNPSLLLDSIMNTFGHEIIGNAKGSRQSQGIDSTKLDKIRGAHILLVEDNAINQQVATELLEAESFVVDIANNGKEATENFDLNNYDCVLMDIQMPIMDGYTATRLLRENDDYIDLPILAMTANATQEDREKSIASGMNAHITKPINPKDLFNTLIKWIKPGERELPVKVTHEAENSTEDKTAELKLIKGISIDEGLKHVNGNKKLLKKLIIDFYNDHNSVLLSIKNDFEGGKLEEVQRAAHTLKGIAGTIGAQSVQERAGELELIIKNNQTELFERSLESLTNVLVPLFEQLKIIADGESVQDESSIVKELVSVEKIHELMVLLAKSLEEMDAESEEQADDLITSLKGYNQNVLLSKLKKQVAAFEFEEAQSILSAIQKNIVNNKSEG
jgi:PAS domain S-box-containing protein